MPVEKLSKKPSEIRTGDEIKIDSRWHVALTDARMSEPATSRQPAWWRIEVRCLTGSYPVAKPEYFTDLMMVQYRKARS